MSTRSTIHFHSGTNPEPEAIVYRHSDGYPSGVLPDLDAFFAAVEEGVGQNGGRPDTRFNDPNYLAAKFVVWQTQAHRRRSDEFRAEMRKGSPELADSPYYADSKSELDFLGTGVMMSDPNDIEYRYHVHCDTSPMLAEARPMVTFDEIGGRSGLTAEDVSEEDA